MAITLILTGMIQLTCLNQSDNSFVIQKCQKDDINQQNETKPKTLGDFQPGKLNLRIKINDKKDNTDIDDVNTK